MRHDRHRRRDRRARRCRRSRRLRVGPGRAAPRRRSARPGCAGVLPYTLARSALRPGVHLPVVHAVPAAAQRAGPGRWLRHQRRHRLRRWGCSRRAAWRAVGRPRRPDRRGRAHGRCSAWRPAVALPVAIVLGRYWQDRIRDLMGVAPDRWSPRSLVRPVAAVRRSWRSSPPHAACAGSTATSTAVARWIGPRAADVLTGAVIVVAPRWSSTAWSSTGRRGSRTARSRCGHDHATRRDATGLGAALRRLRHRRSAGTRWAATAARSSRAARPRPGSRRSAGGTAQTPIRAYAGLDSAAGVEDRARLAVDDLDGPAASRGRAGGGDDDRLRVDRSRLPGRAGVPDRRRRATVSMQYSYLPSWLSYLVDQDRARDAGRELFDAVYARWSDLPPDARPRLFVSGESLGSFAAEAAFSGEFDLRNRTAGALMAGPPNFNVLLPQLRRRPRPRQHRGLPGLPDGRTVRFSTSTDRPVPPVGQPWNDARVLYMQHPSDPVVWWNTDLILARPDWLEEPRGRDVVDAVRWIPFVTFWQVTFDIRSRSTSPPGTATATRASTSTGGWRCCSPRARPPAASVGTPPASSGCATSSGRPRDPQVASSSIGGRSPGVSRGAAAAAAEDPFGPGVKPLGLTGAGSGRRRRGCAARRCGG